MACFGESGVFDWANNCAYCTIVSSTARQYEFEQNHEAIPTNLHDQLPPREVAGNLIQRYFDTLQAVYSICDQHTIQQEYEDVLCNTKEVGSCSMLQILLIAGLADATMPEADETFSRASVLGWINLASSLPQTSMHLQDFNIETVKLWALINLSRQVVTVDDVTDYIYTSVALRSAMVMGLHRRATWHLSSDRKGLWETLLELNLGASISAGLPPSEIHLSKNGHLGYEDVQTLSRQALSSSLALRLRIARELNGEQLMEFSKFVIRVFNTFTAVLHRPFAVLLSPAFHYSRMISLSPAIQDVVRLWDLQHDRAARDGFESLLFASGTFMRPQPFQAVLILCPELIRPHQQPNTAPLLDSLSLPLEVQRDTIYAVINVAMRVFGLHLHLHELTATAFLICYMCSAHYNANLVSSLGSGGYHHKLREAAAEAEKLMPGSS
ncbi:hypothetical protein K431DRAFT_339570 [Polychaeton citri CBS 116435]|uniref:Transcription factor domain-containing protein n=1 Tax=Polychaeton citri CBS 116435 TaxID=1314669 RepID=A0A9P4Q853_9PEZI|nr:hypothetical protein K431DRAFT_339570 [Polychaeton citri CBS 116435]